MSTRPKFAHTIKPIDFSDPGISTLCADLDYPIKYIAKYNVELNNRDRFLLSCWFCRSLIFHVRHKNPKFEENEIIFDVMAEARYAAEPLGISDALPHVPPRTSGRKPSGT
jgi:hypothetical protein